MGWRVHSVIETSIRGVIALCSGLCCRCPACQKFQPAYQEVAAHYADNPSFVIARLDCAVYVSECVVEAPEMLVLHTDQARARSTQ